MLLFRVPKLSYRKATVQEAETMKHDFKKAMQWGYRGAHAPEPHPNLDAKTIVSPTPYEEMSTRSVYCGSAWMIMV